VRRRLHRRTRPPSSEHTFDATSANNPAGSSTAQTARTLRISTSIDSRRVGPTAVAGARWRPLATASKARRHHQRKAASIVDVSEPGMR
jgi:hypothetical protein